MPRLPRRSLRTKLQLFALLLVVLPGVLFALIAFASARRFLQQAVGRQLAEIAHDGAERLEATIAEQRTNLRTWARQDVMRDLLIGDLDKRLTRFLLSLEESGAPYRDLLVTDADGRIVAASEPRLIGAPIGDRASVRTALAGDDAVVGPHRVPDADVPVLELAVPVRDVERGGAVIGAVIGFYDWRRAVVETAHVGENVIPLGLTADVLILDRAGAVIGGDGPAGVQPLPAASRPRWSVDEDLGTLVGAAAVDDARLGWTTVVRQPLDEAFAPIRELQQRFALALGIVLLGALAIAAVLARRLSRPLHELTRATEEMARAGAPPPPVTVRSDDEIGQLSAAFNRMTGELRRAQDDLVAAARFAFVGEMAAGIAHEVRTPLGILRSSAQILGRSLSGDDAQARELVEMIVDEVDRLDRVVTGLLELARPRAPVVEPTSLAVVLQRALDFVETQARERGVRLSRDFLPAPPARCDPEQIYQVALNLVVNALQILPAGGHVTVRVRPAGGRRVAFEVTDDGPGIPLELRERIFAPFFTRRPGGTGLGLALVQRVVQAHHGSVGVDSVVGRGTTFRVELPIAEEPS